ncbi:TPA: hypothetical protein MJE31_10530 [Klebsiella pneumoniae]|uniref:hypothetical protein n=1 Tax=Klebsiella pneumoniae TaxID=573 RepID=UPI00068F9FD7|nr:hypothetical protein [Klebsiella pneumoniae]MCS5947899.1 hypothetical protein [Klebsiella pneumoniae subsp. pneumoniae]ELC0796542.1 hypothetical protein [Klebsiella pneumoniae]ELH4120538.1 hypothetical protein [Klebsiella pneumoniae]EMF2171300.1 hypothetical protein [Klebsiella pneumoniae]MBC4251639.1 hypothetical protein [Klebsiella pneumoniae]
MTSKLTRERLSDILEFGSGRLIKPISDEEIELMARMALAAMDSETHDAISFDEWSRKCALQITLCYPDFREKAQYIWDSARETQQPAPVVPEEATPDSIEILASARRRDHAVFQWDEDQRNAAADSWNACRAAMLQAYPVCTCPSGDGSLRWPCPVHPGNSPAIPDSARDALEKALAAMEFMGDTLNNLDAVCTEDVELVAPAFDAVRSVLAAAPQEGK